MGRLIRRIPVARKPMVEIVCSRCPAKEYVPYDPSMSEDKKEPDLIIVFEGKQYQFDDLCSKCKKTVKAYVEGAIKDIKASRKEMAKKRSSTGRQSSSPKVKQPPPAPPASGAG